MDVWVDMETDMETDTRAALGMKRTQTRKLAPKKEFIYGTQTKQLSN